MSVAAMVKQPPPTPPTVGSRQLQDGFGHLVQHSAQNEDQANTYALDNSAYLPSGVTSFDNTPEPEIGQWYMDQYGNKTFRLYQEQNTLGMDMSFVCCTRRLAGRKTDEKTWLMNDRMRTGSKPSYLSNKVYTILMLSNSNT